MTVGVGVSYRRKLECLESRTVFLRGRIATRVDLGTDNAVKNLHRDRQELSALLWAIEVIRQNENAARQVIADRRKEKAATP